MGNATGHSLTLGKKVRVHALVSSGRGSQIGCNHVQISITVRGSRRIQAVHIIRGTIAIRIGGWWWLDGGPIWWSRHSPDGVKRSPVT